MVIINIEISWRIAAATVECDMPMIKGDTDLAVGTPSGTICKCSMDLFCFRHGDHSSFSWRSWLTADNLYCKFAAQAKQTPQASHFSVQNEAKRPTYTCKATEWKEFWVFACLNVYLLGLQSCIPCQCHCNPHLRRVSPFFLLFLLLNLLLLTRKTRLQQERPSTLEVQLRFWPIETTWDNMRQQVPTRPGYPVLKVS